MATEGMDRAKRQLVLNNTIGIVNAYGWPWQEALEIALDQNQPLFSKRLKIRKTGGTSGGHGGTGRGGQMGDAGGITGG